MTPREWADAHLLPYEHPELWSEADRGRYLLWRLSEYAAWLRSNVPRETLRERRREIRERVDFFRQERAALYRKRFLHCECRRCLPQNAHPFYARVERELTELAKGIHERSGR